MPAAADCAAACAAACAEASASATGANMESLVIFALIVHGCILFYVFLLLSKLLVKLSPMTKEQLPQKVQVQTASLGLCACASAAAKCGLALFAP
eukprot:6172345-Pleurochrysis_carterae.AAC.1